HRRSGDTSMAGSTPGITRGGSTQTGLSSTGQSKAAHLYRQRSHRHELPRAPSLGSARLPLWGTGRLPDDASKGLICTGFGPAYFAGDLHCLFFASRSRHSLARLEALGARGTVRCPVETLEAHSISYLHRAGDGLKRSEKAGTPR